MLTDSFLRPCPFSQGDIYNFGGRWLKVLGFGKIMGDSQGVSGANPEFSATAEQSGISSEISPFERAHGLILNIREMALES